MARSPEGRLVAFMMFGICNLALVLLSSLFFFFNDTATTEIYTLSLHDALPISSKASSCWCSRRASPGPHRPWRKSEEHTSELQSQFHLVCRLLLEKKKSKL